MVHAGPFSRQKPPTQMFVVLQQSAFFSHLSPVAEHMLIGGLFEHTSFPVESGLQ